jgi:hypothetical protein
MSHRFHINLGGGSQGGQTPPQGGYGQPPSGYQGPPYQPPFNYGAPPRSFGGPNQPQQSYGPPPRNSRDLPPRRASSFSGGPGLSFPTSSGGPRMTRANGEQINFTMDELRDAMDELGYGAPPRGFEDPYQPQQGYESSPRGFRGSPYEPQQRRDRFPPRGAPASSDPMDRPYRRMELDNGESYVYTRRQWEALMRSMDSISDEPQQAHRFPNTQRQQGYGSPPRSSRGSPYEPEQLRGRSPPWRTPLESVLRSMNSMPEEPQQPQRFPNTPGSRRLYQLGETMHDDSDLIRSSGQRGNCFFCRERMAPGDHDARKLPCGHVFGLECIFNWVGEQANNDRNAGITGIATVSCPVCRRQFEVQDP